MTDAAGVRDFDLVILGTGSANSIPGPEFNDWSIAIVERGSFGGTCLNVGCIPSKMFVYAADVATSVRNAARYGVDAQLNSVDWPAIRDRVFGRIDPIAAGGRDYRTGPECPNTAVFLGDATFVAPKTLEVALATGGTATVRGRHVVIGAGARPFIPPYPGLDDPAVGYHTSDTVMRLESLPERMVVLGGGFIACELGYVFAALGTHVTIVNRGDVLLRAEDTDVARHYTELTSDVIDCRLGATVTGVRRDSDGVTVTFERDGEVEAVTGDELLVATGRVPNGDQLNLAATGVQHDRGRVLADDCFRTTAEGVWAFGDVSSVNQLKHLANAQVRALRENLLTAERLAEAGDDPWGSRAGDAMLTVSEAFLPHAVFTHPQVAAVGLTERAAAEAGLNYVAASKAFGDTAYGWAMEDTTSFCKLIASADTHQLLGAHIMGPQAPTLISQLVAAMEAGQTVQQQARGMFYIHPALTEVVENCLLDVVEQLGGA